MVTNWQLGCACIVVGIICAAVLITAAILTMRNN